MSRKPDQTQPLPPRPKGTRPIKPLTAGLMARVMKQMDRHRITQGILASELDTHQQCLSEYFSASGRSPSGEMTLRLLRWTEKMEAMKFAIDAHKKTRY